MHQKKGALDAGFRLASAGEYLALINPDNEVVSEFAPTYPEQFNGVSSGIPSGGRAPAFLNQAGSPAPETMFFWIKRNGTDMGLFSFVEQVDEEFLGRHGFDASGSLYKAINVPAALSPTVNTRLYRKLLRKDEPYIDLIDFTANINIANPHRFAYVADEVNLPNYINVMAAMAVPSNRDQLTKNY
ncbi:MAG: CotH kinase family protein [Verrucomicrobiota bacterium]